MESGEWKVSKSSRGVTRHSPLSTFHDMPSRGRVQSLAILEKRAWLRIMPSMQSRHLLQPRDNPSLVSIVIPAYNEEETLPALRSRLEGFLATLPCPAELIVVNDGSSDRTLDLLLEWA